MNRARSRNRGKKTVQFNNFLSNLSKDILDEEYQKHCNYRSITVHMEHGCIYTPATLLSPDLGIALINSAIDHRSYAFGDIVQVSKDKDYDTCYTLLRKITDYSKIPGKFNFEFDPKLNDPVVLLQDGKYKRKSKGKVIKVNKDASILVKFKEGSIESTMRFVRESNVYFGNLAVCGIFDYYSVFDPTFYEQMGML
jgi:hypothetical protein